MLVYLEFLTSVILFICYYVGSAFGVRRRYREKEDYLSDIYQIEHKLLKPKYFYKQNRRDEFAINLVS
jgi:hypothetical protein